ncbi:MAG: NADH-quinone oxidoreductase subunit N [Anaerolineae bacterium]|nr:NADH-quinone oxidoreductase subunit N [Anaerolineae bacterium]
MTPSISLENVLAILPDLALLVLLIAVIVYNGLIADDDDRRNVGLLTAWGAAIILFGMLLLAFIYPDYSMQPTLHWGGMVVAGPVTLSFRAMFLIALMLTALLSLDVPELQRGSYFALLITATIGFDMMAASADLIMLLVALETASISLYLLVGFNTRSRRSTEAGIKYFVYGAFASAIMMYGMSLLYGVTGSTNIAVIGTMVGNAFAGVVPVEIISLLLVSAVMLVAGFAFKVSAVPFHFWTPDAYEGAPTVVTGFLSTASKAAGFAVFFRVFSAGVFGYPEPGRASWAWWAMLVAMCILTMVLGNFLAIWQQDIKRMLAYSSIAQAGYIMMGLVALLKSQGDDVPSAAGGGAAIFYLLMYVFTNIAAFGIIVLVSHKSNSTQMKDFYGLSRRSPWLALAMLVALLSLGGIPPTAGFFGKFFIFQAAVEADLWWLAAIGILNAFVALFYYLTVVKYIYLYRSDDDDVRITVSRAAGVGLAITIVAVLYLGIFANSAYTWAIEAAQNFVQF